MSLSESNVGKAISDYLVANAPPAGTLMTDSMRDNLWRGVMGIIYADVKNTAEVSSDIIANSINTVGGPAAQAGPPAPVTVSGTVS